MSIKITIKGAVVFITAANRKRGIGRALVEEAVTRGATKIYATARNIAELDDLVAKHQGIVVPIKLDVTNNEEVKRVAKIANDTQILINNAGLAESCGMCFGYDEQHAREEMEVNYWGIVNVTRAFCTTVINNKGGIANIISIAALSTFPAAGTYSASKAAAHSLTQTVRAELAPHNIPVFGIYPGPIDTDMADGLNFGKASPQDAAIRIFDGMSQGIEDITTDNFADSFVQNLKLDAKAVEKNNADFVHKMASI